MDQGGPIRATGGGGIYAHSCVFSDGPFVCSDLDQRPERATVKPKKIRNKKELVLKPGVVIVAFLFQEQACVGVCLFFFPTGVIEI